MRAAWLVLVLAGCPSKEPPKDQPDLAVSTAKRLGLVDPAKAQKPLDVQPANPIAKPDTPTDPHARRTLAAGVETRGQFGVGPGYLYYCDGRAVRGVPKNGDTPVTIGACEGTFQFMGDQHGIYYCNDKAMMRGVPGTTTASQVAGVDDCIMAAVDNTDVYYIVPGFEGIPNPGLYKVSRTSGDPVKLLATGKGEQISVALDGDDIWISFFGGGVIQKLKKSGGQPVTVISGQKALIDIGVDDKYVYWLVQQESEVRRRPKAGGAIETIGKDAGSQLIVFGKTAYWTDKVEQVLIDDPSPKATARVMRLAQGATKPDAIATDLLGPHIEVDADGLYIDQLRKTGVLFVPN